MSRPIKFRAWDKVKNRFWWNVQNAYDTLGDHCTPNEDDDASHTDDLYGDSFGDVLKNADMVVEQFTGLHDKTGREIFEGDIVRLATYGTNDPRKVQEVEWSEDRAGFVTSHSPFIPTNTQRSFDADCDWLFECEVIGNVHENPELLK